MQIASSQNLYLNDYYIAKMLFRYFELTNKRVFKLFYGEELVKIKKSKILDNNFDISFYPDIVLDYMEKGDLYHAFNFQNYIIRRLKTECSINKINYFRDVFLYVNNNKKIKENAPIKTRKTI